MAKFSGVNALAYDSLTYSYAYGDDSSSTAAGGSNASTSFVGSKFKGLYDYGIYNYAYDSGKGKAVASPVVTGSTLTAEQGSDAIYNYARSEYAGADAMVTVDRSTLYSYGNLIYSDALADNSSPETATAGANASTKFTNSTGRVGYSGRGIFNQAYDYAAGKATASPVITYSTLSANHDYNTDDNVYNYSYSSYGPAESMATVYDSTIEAYYSGIEFSHVSDDMVIKVLCRDNVVREYTLREYLYRLQEEPDSWPAQGLRVLKIGRASCRERV